MINSRLGLFHCDHLAVAPLIPKLRGQYAEFLNNPSPVGLRILSSSTCVGLRYGRPSYSSRLFSLSIHRTSLLNFSPFRPGLPTPGFRLLNMSACLNLDGYGISTVCASTTPFGLALAPGLPVAEDFRPLRFSRNSRYSFRHSHSNAVHTSFRSCFTPHSTLPYQS